jgi:heme-degrading monooxygenase HmoA
MTVGGQAQASGNWHTSEGSEEEFVERWTSFLEWTKATVPGFAGASLIRDVADPRHFVSFAIWESSDARSRWQAHEGFAERLGGCRALCDDFTGASFELASRVE